MTSINAIIIDDEPICIDNLGYHLAAYCPDINIVATGNSLREAREIFNSCKFEIAFLDIELFDLSIFELFTDATASYQFDIVFVTAYDSYAIKAIRIDALDYLLKPLSRQEIECCYDRIKKRRKENTGLATAPEVISEKAASNKKIILKSGNQVYVIKYTDIVYFKAHGAYTEIVFFHSDQKKTITVSKLINVLEKEYHDACFCRVHKSFIVNTAMVTGIVKKSGVLLEMAGSDLIPVAKRRAEYFFGIYTNTPR